MILCGDLNCTFEKKDKSNKRSFETINNLDFVDLWHHKYPQNNGFTEIWYEMCNFYENFYTSKSTNDEKIADFIEEVDCPKLNTQDKKNYDKLPTLVECKDAVLYLKIPGFRCSP